MIGILAFFKNLKPAQILLIVVILLSVFAAILIGRIEKLKIDNNRLDNNTKTLQKGLNAELTKSGDLAYKVGILELEKSEIKEYYEEEVINNLKDLNIRLNKLESFSSTSTESTHNVTTTLRDSVIIRDGEIQPIKYIDYKSEWLDFYQVQAGDLIETKIVKRDSLIQVVYQPKKSGFFLSRVFKKKPPLEQVIKSSDPNTQIKYAKYIVPVKR